MEFIQNVALAGGLAWASGIRLYAALFLTGMLAKFGVIELPDTLQPITHPIVLGASGVMLVAEFLVDKIPGFDSLWDAVHTFIRIPAGAILAAGSIGSIDPAYMTAAAIVGGMIASTSHAAKAGGRALINTSPEPFSNWAASLAEDVIAPVGLAIAFKFPVMFLASLTVFLIVAIILIRFLVEAVRNLFRRRYSPTGAPR